MQRNTTPAALAILSPFILLSMIFINQLLNQLIALIQWFFVAILTPYVALQ